MSGTRTGRPRGRPGDFAHLKPWETDDPEILPFTEIVRLLAKYPGAERAGKQTVKKSVITRQAIAMLCGVSGERLREIATGDSKHFGRKTRRAVSKVLRDLESGELQWRTYAGRGRLVRLAEATRAPDMQFKLVFDKTGRPTIEQGAPLPVKRRMPNFRDFSLPGKP